MTSTLLAAGIALVTISFLFLIAFLQNSVDENRLILATPNIPRQKAVLSSFASIKIKANADEVFAALINFNDYSKWSTFSSHHKWNQVIDGVPLVGSSGTFRLLVEEFADKTIPIKLTLLDREEKQIAERTTSYPPWLLGSERVQEVSPVEGQPGFCEYRTWQTAEGIAAYYLLFLAKEEVDEGLKQSAEGLKFFIEHPDSCP